MGTRGFTFRSGVIHRSQALGFRVVSIDELPARGFAETIAEFRDAAAGRPVDLCRDIHRFDPSLAPGVSTPAWGGLPAIEEIALLHRSALLSIVVPDFNPLSPAHDIDGMAAHLSLPMIAEAMPLFASRFGLLPAA